MQKYIYYLITKSLVSVFCRFGEKFYIGVYSTIMLNRMLYIDT